MKKISQWFGGRRAGASSMSALEETCQHYAAKLEALAHVLSVIEFNPQGLILEVNPQFLRVSGYGQQDLIGQPHHILLPEHAKASSGDVFWSSLAAGKVAQGEYQFRTQSGQELWLQASYTPILDAAGQLVKVLMFASDITLQKQQQLEFSGRQAALDKVLGVIEFSLDGHILALNHNFEHVTGYTAAELVGQHHRLLMPPEVVSTAAYQQFWQRLAQGQADSGVYKRIGKHGQEIWLQASYNPIFDVHGKPYKVVKYATDITAQKQKEADDHGQINAIHHIMAVIEFDLTGHVVDANEHFLRAVGYEKSEIVGQHHRMFVPTEQRNSQAYQQFWPALAQGNAQSGLFQRVNKAGHSLWLNASYIPIVDLNGKPYKVVKYATDVTQQHQKDIDNAGQIDSINRSLGTIEFSLDGQIQKVNQNFLNVVGYDAAEVIGQYHRLFMPEHAGQSAEYQSFWKKLAQGQFQAGVFKRKGKQGQDIWLQASYNPVLNDAGQPIKVVKFAIDITSQKVTEIGLIQAVAETQRLLEFAQQGDMTARIDLHGKTEQILNLSRGINALMDMVSQILLQFKTSADMINTAAHEISSGNIDLSTRTEKQAHSLQDTAASMEQLASTVKQNADSAKQANQLAVNATKVAERGSNAMHEVVSTMNAINDSAKKIEDIISVIDSIAFQTNILALNAAVEAARAGDQGKGFAVVAGEVRNLAQRSASAAKEIKELITDSVNKTTEGSNLVTGAGATMTEIMQSVQHVSAIISDISTASMEQTSGIDQVNLAISSMDDVTQQNAALVEEAAATAESLVEQASQLSEIVSGFKLELAHGQTGALTSAKSTGTYD